MNRIYLLVISSFLLFYTYSFSQSNYDLNESEEIFTVVETMPEFPGGEKELIKFLSDNLKYPKVDKKNRYQGKVVVQFIVGKNGKLHSHEIVKSSGSETLDEEALRVIKLMPDWTPGYIKDKPVIVKFLLPIKFTLQ